MSQHQGAEHPVVLTLYNFTSNEGNITEVSHDYQYIIKQYVEELRMVNSYDTWHGMLSICFQCVLLEVSAGTKNVAKELRKICAGLVHARDPDKGMFFLEIFTINGISLYSARSTKVHLYWCMRNCGGNPNRLRAMIMNISKHFQVCVYT